MEAIILDLMGKAKVKLREGASARGIRFRRERNLSYYDVELKKARLNVLERNSRFNFSRIDISDRGEMEPLFERGRFERVIHLAAQPGVRYSLRNPFVYCSSNILGFTIRSDCLILSA